MVRSMEADEISEVNRDEDPLHPGHLGVGFDLLSDPLHQGEIGLQSFLLLREEIEEGFGIGVETPLPEMKLKAGVDISDVMDGDKLDLFVGSNLLENLEKFKNQAVAFLLEKLPAASCQFDILLELDEL